MTVIAKMKARKAAEAERARASKVEAESTSLGPILWSTTSPETQDDALLITVKRLAEGDDGPVVYRGPAGPVTLIEGAPMSLTTRAGMRMALRKAGVCFETMKENGSTKAIPIPLQILDELLEEQGYSGLPALSGVTDIPVLRYDGSVTSTPGYDPKSEVYFCPRSEDEWDVEVDGDPHEVMFDALSIFEQPFSEVPFAAPHHRSAALALLLTTVCRDAVATKYGISSAPMTVITSPKAGSGKGLVAEVVSAIATGSGPAMHPWPGEIEAEKLLVSLLRDGERIAVLDNVPRGTHFDLPAWQSVVTSAAATIRPFGRSDTIKIKNIRLVPVVTGNTLMVADDWKRRTMLVKIDAGVERPEMRRFAKHEGKSALLAWVMGNRALLASAAIRFVRAWILSKYTCTPPSTMSDFDTWSRVIREALLFVGETDPRLGQAEVAEDSEGEATHRALVEIAALWGSGWFKSNDLYAALQGGDTLRTLIDEAGGNTESAQRVGKWLRGVATSGPFGGAVLEHSRALSRGVRQFRVVAAAPPLPAENTDV